MSASHEMVAADVRRIEQLVRECQFPEIVEVTNKRSIMRCPDIHTAKVLALRIQRSGYQYQLRRGLKSEAWYVQAWY